ncbi:Fumarylacetoacetate (FAA) hydrolase family protein [Fulvimarina manganoxydans]|uniref:Fumarylacetoacetate (FAA) hydrolase family protein n=1 Tax=Fulvimarina manganoxydans TaxID=937218 RepID=A0A1W1YBG8_9HYPH|nr:fumarylacetoacetate hydrolase family protein [Fulvimarina manganoxydans]SMC33507.1 Fumarylacetoacetate (FAA) hydrolase family protein [Fulvimarina manganoxydans]
MANESILPETGQGHFVGRVFRSDMAGPSVVTIRDGRVIDVTSKQIATTRDLLEHADPAAVLDAAKGEDIGSLDEIASASIEPQGEGDLPRLLAPCDLQSVKACGVTFARSMLERVIEERAAGNADLAAEIREKVSGIIGESLRDIKAGSDEAGRIKTILVKEGLWSQYLEVGIGPDAEVFTKAPVLASVGWGASVGLNRISRWNNPEPEIVLAVDSHGKVKGAALGNDVNLRDVEGRSALLLGKAKDNNASSSIGPFIRLFDETYEIEDVRSAELSMTVKGEDGFVLKGRSSMKEISRDPLDLVRQTIGGHHQYPDGFLLYLGTLFAPVEDRGETGQGFTHHIGDVVTIAEAKLGSLRNTVRYADECPPWTFGTASLMRNLAARALL